ncbi:MAG: 5-methylthioadenosine/S-adenosylhomocysteine nucleosidase [Planctomycetota bacterium]|jgi:adenosylhomocysteine nucleosidase
MASSTDVRPTIAAGIVFAMPIEADAFARCVHEVVVIEAAGLTFQAGQVAGRSIAWCVGGAGEAAAAKAARLLIAGHRPRLVVSAGFAGGLDPDLVRGLVLEPVRSLREAGGPPLELGLRSAPALPFGPSAAADPTGPSIVTVAEVVTSPAAKRALATKTGAVLVDMETYAVAEAARDAGLPCAALRVVSDTAGQELPREVTALARPQSGMRRLGVALGAIGRRPRAALDLWQLWENAVVDGRTLGHAIEDFCRRLPE